MRSLTVAAAAALMLLPAAPAWAANSAPVVVDDTRDVDSVAVPNRIDALANDSDPDGDPLVYSSVGTPTKGTAYIHTNGLLYYQPYQFETGTDSFTYSVSDGQGNTTTGTVTITLWSDLPAPTGLGISAPNATSATLSWPAAPDAAQYQIFRNTQLVHTTSATSWTDTGIPADAHLDYRIASVNGGGFGGQQSASVHRYAQARTPTDLAVSVTADPTALHLTWANGGYGPTGTGPWNVYRDGSLVGSSPTRAFTDTDLDTGREYSYQVQSAGLTSSTAVSPPGALTAAVRGTPVVPSSIGQFFFDQGGPSGDLGAITVPERAVPGGRQQDHARGVIVQRDGEDPITVRVDFATAYTAAGGVSGQLGFPLAERECGLRENGCGQFFDGGSIWYQQSAGTRVVPQFVEDVWAINGWEEGPLGYPNTGTICGLRDGGCFQGFEGGAVTRSPATGTRAVVDVFFDTWAHHWGEAGPLGYPTTDEICGLKDDGCVQVFQGGVVAWSPTADVRAVFGPILATYGRLGGEAGRLGYPTGEQVCGLRDGGCFQQFQGGAIAWSPATGARATFGAFLTTWGRHWGEAGRLGYPAGDEICGLKNGGCFQQFQGGALAWSPTTGGRAVFGNLLAAWGRHWGEAGRLGYPNGDEICGLRNGGCFQQFEGGALAWSPATGAHAVYTPYLTPWGAWGGEAGRLGYPTTGEICGLRGGGCTQHFQGGSIYATPGRGFYAVAGTVRDLWGSQGWQDGRLGYPISSEISDLRGGSRQEFQGGTIYVTPRGARIGYNL